jgi:hypothetical protein
VSARGRFRMARTVARRKRPSPIAHHALGGRIDLKADVDGFVYGRGNTLLRGKSKEEMATAANGHANMGPAVEAIAGRCRLDRSVEFAPLGCRLSEGPGPPTGAVPDKAARRHALASHPPACGEGG